MRQCCRWDFGWWNTGLGAPPKQHPEIAVGWATTLREAKGCISRPKCSPGLRASEGYLCCLSLGTKLQHRKLFPLSCLWREISPGRRWLRVSKLLWIISWNISPLIAKAQLILKEQLSYILYLKMSIHLHFSSYSLDEHLQTITGENYWSIFCTQPKNKKRAEWHTSEYRICCSSMVNALAIFCLKPLLLAQGWRLFS